jgi:molybdopterin-guanine dinucleotide biosynthesis protein A
MAPEPRLVPTVASTLAIDPALVTGLILAGGRGTRMGHVDKGLQPFRGATMLAHVMARLAPQTGAIMINANQNLTRYQAFGVLVWPDQLGDFAGPLAGLQSGLAHCSTPYLLSAPCDSPFLPTDLLARLSAGLLAADADLAVAVTYEPDERAAHEHSPLRRQTHPVFCLLKTSLVPHLSAFLTQGGRKVDAWYASLKVAEVVFADASAFRNINTLDDLRKYEAP